MIFGFERISHQEEPFQYVVIYDLINKMIFDRVREEAQRYPYFKIERTRTSNPNRIWINQTPGWLSAIAEEFDRREVKNALGFELGGQYGNLRTRAELCMDSAGSWLEPHRDDPAKEMTLQLYLDGNGRSTSMGDRETTVVPNMAWAFSNAAQPIHSLPPLKYNRASIIINYVNDDWRDQSVLV